MPSNGRQRRRESKRHWKQRLAALAGTAEGGRPHRAIPHELIPTSYPNIDNAIFAAWYPHMPCTPPPGGVDAEQM
jgi:hypothetical protein